MSREIKFRAWEYAHERTQGIGWADSPMVWKMNYEPEIWGGETASEGDRVELNKALERGGDADERYELPNKSIYMQYTGLKDKNGVDIYEGDILQRTNRPNERYSVAWTDFMAGFHARRIEHPQGERGYGFSVVEPDEYKVIGNIYENPELLEAAHA